MLMTLITFKEQNSIKVVPNIINKKCCACNIKEAKYFLKINDRLAYKEIKEGQHGGGWVTVCDDTKCFEYVKLLYC